jgi:hypothetical protein
VCEDTDIVQKLHIFKILSAVVGRAMAKAVSRWPLTVAARVRAQVNPVEFVVDKVALGQVFPPSPSVFPCQYHSTVGSIFPKIKKKVLSFTHSFTHSFILIRGRTIGP